MKESNEILDKIELYTKGKLSLEERLAFEKDLASDADLRNQLEYSLLVDQMVIVGEAMKLKEQMGKDLAKAKSGMWSYLAVTLLVVTAGTGLFVMFNKEDKTQIAAPISVEPKNIKLAEVPAQSPEGKVIDNQNPVPGITDKPKTDTEKKANTTFSSSLQEPAATFVQPSVPVHTLPSGSGQAASSAKAIQDIPQTVAAKVDLCAGLTGNVEFYTVASCKGQETGEVHVKAETVKGGLAPFIFKIGEKTAKDHFTHLAPGAYELFIKDANGCAVENSKKVEVGEKKCMAKKEYVFNPEYDPSWPIPYDSERKAVNFVIQEKSGKEFYKTAVSSSQPTDWKGESNTGLTLGIGLYFFTIEYADGSVDEGSIVVSR